MNTYHLLEYFEAKMAHHTVLYPPVSEGSVGWHLDHSLRVIIKVVDAIAEPKAEPFRWRFNAARLYVLSLGHIPRGSARSPREVQPEEVITEPALRKRLSVAYQKLAECEQLSAGTHWPHPYFGELNQRMTRRFLYVHTHHHQKIMRDILAGWQGRGK
jgi:hypothetical protein